MFFLQQTTTLCISPAKAPVTMSRHSACQASRPSQFAFVWSLQIKEMKQHRWATQSQNQNTTYFARSMVIFVSRLERFILWLSWADNLWEMFWTREKSSSFDFLTYSKLLFILASAILLSLSVDTTTSLWFPEIITFSSKAVVLTRADQAIWGTATKHI